MIEKKKLLKSKITYFTLVLMRCEAQKNIFDLIIEQTKKIKKNFQKIKKSKIKKRRKVSLF